jgi:hypothetical protein
VYDLTDFFDPEDAMNFTFWVIQSLCAFISMNKPSADPGNIGIPYFFDNNN